MMSLSSVQVFFYFILLFVLQNVDMSDVVQCAVSYIINVIFNVPLIINT